MFMSYQLVLLALVALVAFSPLSEAAAGLPVNGLVPDGPRARRKWRRKLDRGTITLPGNLNVTDRNIVWETDTYTPGMAYFWANSDCSGTPYAAIYFGTACADHEGEASTRYNCVITGTDPTTGQQMAEIQLHAFGYPECNHDPVYMSRSAQVLLGECDHGSILECSTELKYGLENNTVAYACMDSECQTLYHATFYPRGCDGDGFKDFCEDDELVSQVYEHDDCTGSLQHEENRYPENVCQLPDFDGIDDDDDIRDFTYHEMFLCNGSDVNFPDSINRS